MFSQRTRIPKDPLLGRAATAHGGSLRFTAGDSHIIVAQQLVREEPQAAHRHVVEELASEDTLADFLDQEAKNGNIVPLPCSLNERHELLLEGVVGLTQRLALLLPLLPRREQTVEVADTDLRKELRRRLVVVIGEPRLCVCQRVKHRAEEPLEQVVVERLDLLTRHAVGVLGHPALDPEEQQFLPRGEFVDLRPVKAGSLERGKVRNWSPGVEFAREQHADLEVDLAVEDEVRAHQLAYGMVLLQQDENLFKVLGVHQVLDEHQHAHLVREVERRVLGGLVAEVPEGLHKGVLRNNHRARCVLRAHDDQPVVATVVDEEGEILPVHLLGENRRSTAFQRLRVLRELDRSRRDGLDRDVVVEVFFLEELVDIAKIGRQNIDVALKNDDVAAADNGLSERERLVEGVIVLLHMEHDREKGPAVLLGDAPDHLE